MLESIGFLIRAVFSHWVQSLGGTGMAVFALVAQIRGWEVPSSVLLALSGFLFLWAVAKVFHEQRTRLAKEEAAVRELAVYQRRADKLTEKYRYGVQRLINERPWGVDALTAWQTECRKWYSDVVTILKSTGCTPQDVNHFETVLREEWYQAEGSAEDETVALMKIRLQRLADISTKYAQRAEDTEARRKLGH